jgi:hypothetical protein
MKVNKMKNQTQEQVERDAVKRIAREYIFAPRASPSEMEDVLKRTGVSFKHRLQALGVTPDIYVQFVNEVAQLGGYYEDLAESLAVDPLKIKVPQDNGETFSLDTLLNTGDRVLIAQHPVFKENKRGQFLTGFNPDNETFTLSAEQVYSGHSKLKGRTLQDHTIIEGGFIAMYPLQKSITLFEESSTYHVFPGNISLNLLNRALPDWHIERG